MTARKKMLIDAILAVLLTLGSGCHKATLENYKLFRSTPLGFSIEYPDFWTKESDPSEGIAVFVTPAEGYADEHLESLSVQRFTLDAEGETAFNDYVKGYVADLESTLKNYKLVSETDTTLDGQPAYQIVYESSTDADEETGESESEMRFMHIFAEWNGQVYVLSYIAEFGSYSYFLTYVVQMISTFQFLG